MFSYPPVKKIWGSDKEPLSSLWLASLSEAMGEHFGDEMIVLDYGCGRGRYGNFLGRRLSNFTYYGLEREGQSSKAISWLMEETSELENVHFGFIGSDLEDEALGKANVVVLGNIFTHLLFQCKEESKHGDSFVTICNKFMPLVERGGVVVFSAFIDSKMRQARGAGHYGLPNCYGLSYYTMEALQGYCEEKGFVLTEREFFSAQNGKNNHRIFRIEGS